MITLHHLHPSRSFRVVWLMEELGLPYDLICHEGTPGHPIAALRALHRLGKAPLVIDGETTLFESGAILEYVVHRYGQGRLSVPSHHHDYALYLVWMHAPEGTCMPTLVPLARHAIGMGPAPSEPQLAQHAAVLGLCEDALAHRDYFGGDAFTIADIMMDTYLGAVTRFANDNLDSRPHLAAFVDRVQGREAFRRAHEVAGSQTPSRA